MSEPAPPSFAATDTTLDALAQAGFDAVYADPRWAEDQLRQVLEQVVLERAAGNGRAMIVALWGLARLHHNDGAHDAAVGCFERAIAAAEASGHHEELANIRISAAITFQIVGDGERALRELDLARSGLAADALGRWAGQRALVLLNLGRAEEAVRAFDAAIRSLADGDDVVALARTYANRGVTHLQRSTYGAARTDLTRAAELSAAAGEHVVAAIALHNLGYLEARLGHIPAALRLYDRARTAFTTLGGSGRLLASLDIDHGEICLSVGLAPEALAIADRLIVETTRSGDFFRLGEARLMRVRALTMLGHREAAAAEAELAAQVLEDTDRQTWAAVAGYLGVVAMWESGPASAASELDERLASLADALATHGWRNEAAEVHTVRSHWAIQRNDLIEARRHLHAATRVRRRASSAQRAQAALARALLYAADGDTVRALGEARRGLGAVDSQRAGLGSSELRAASSAAAVPLVRLGLGIAITADRPGDALRWAERGRAATLTAPPTAPPDDPLLAAALTELRELGSDDGDGRAAELELEILRRRRLDAADPATAAARISLRAVRARLGTARLIEYVEHAGRLRAIVVDRTRAAIVDLGDTAAVSALVDHALFALRRLSMLPAEHPRHTLALGALQQAAADLDQALLLSAGADRADSIVVVPTGPLHLVPWMTLPTARRCAVVVAPSATWWMSAERSAACTGASGTVVVGGPDLVHVEDELAALGDLYGHHTVVRGSDATVAEVLRRVADADVAHIAAHGHFRADSPMFSSLQMHDGPLNIHDLQSLRRVPRLVVLTACDAGRSGVLAGDELLGTVAALLSLGVSTVIAPLLPIADQPAARVAVALHHALAAGRSPASALASVAREADADGDGTLQAAAMSFLCIGTHESGAARISGRSPTSVAAT